MRKPLFAAAIARLLAPAPLHVDKNQHDSNRQDSQYHLSVVRQQAMNQHPDLLKPVRRACAVISPHSQLTLYETTCTASKELDSTKLAHSSRLYVRPWAELKSRKKRSQTLQEMKSSHQSVMTSVPSGARTRLNSLNTRRASRK